MSTDTDLAYRLRVDRAFESLGYCRSALEAIISGKRYDDKPHTAADMRRIAKDALEFCEKLHRDNA